MTLRFLVDTSIIAHAHELVPVTTNDKDFTRFKGLKVENWAK